MTSKTDKEKLAGILEEFDPTLVEETLDDLALNSDFDQVNYKRLADPGEVVEEGTDAHVAIHELSRIERIIPIGGNNLLPAHFLEEGAVVQKAVVRVVVPGFWLGSGFMVSRSLLMTNNHVLPDTSKASLGKIEFNFQLDHQGKPQTVETYSLDAGDVFYTSPALDFTLVRVSPKCRWVNLPFGATLGNAGLGDELFYQQIVESEPNLGGPSLPGLTPWPVEPPYGPVARGYRRAFRLCTHAGQKWGWLQLSPTLQVALDQHLNIVQHPKGRRKEVAIQDNKVTTIYTNVLRYTTDTQRGSSGSPVFNNGWDLVAIHHAAGDYQNGQWVNNEGVRMDKIMADIRNHFGGSASGDAVLAELGI